ncbi:MAG: 30S ribosomal protein S15 [Rickettsiales bacterium]|nr:30S ribosomal protein S15 [Rickettsiales bacterium]
MSVTAAKKTDLIKQYQTSKNDTGSSEVQIAILSERINNLTMHLKSNKKDFQCRRGLLILVGRRKSLLSYLKKQNLDKYNELIKSLNLRK